MRRDRCCFEGGVSGELLVRLSVYPRMKAELDRLPPKLISLASGRAPEPVELAHSDVWQRVQQVVESIEKATFTGKGDKEKVPMMYKDYVEKVAANYWIYHRIFGADPRTLDAVASGARSADIKLDR